MVVSISQSSVKTIVWIDRLPERNESHEDRHSTVAIRRRTVGCNPEFYSVQKRKSAAQPSRTDKFCRHAAQWQSDKKLHRLCATGYPCGCFDNCRSDCLCEVNECRCTNSDVPPRYHGLQELREASDSGTRCTHSEAAPRQCQLSVSLQYYPSIRRSRTRLLIVTPSNQAADEVLMRLVIQANIPRLQLLLLQSNPANKGWKHLHGTWRSIDCSGHRHRCRDNMLHVQGAS